MWTFQLSRRQLLCGIGAAVGTKANGQAKKPLVQTSGRLYEGTDLTDWTLTVGDGIYAAPGEAPVTKADIETIHYTTHSELRANLERRPIMAHNLMYKKIIDPVARDHIHFCTYEFRLPFLPTKGDSDYNAQTLEGGLSLWDGATSRINYNAAFQWALNPYRAPGTLRVWTSVNSGSWQPAGFLPVDTEWHQVHLMLDPAYKVGSLTIDGQAYLATISMNPGPAGWGQDVSATLAAEIISIYPGTVSGALHMAEFRNWRWAWTPNTQARTFLPIIGQI